MPSPVFKSKRHDTAVSPVVVLTPPAGLDWDLETAGVTVKLIARHPESATPKMSGAAEIVGVWSVQYNPTATDVDTIGTYDVEVEVTNAAGKSVTFPTEGWLSWVIGPDLDNS